MAGTPPSVIPTLRYRDAPGAIRWLVDVFGLTESFVAPGPDGTIAHAQLVIGTGMVMLSSESDGSDGRLAVPHGPTWLYVVLDSEEDLAAHYKRATAAGAEILQPLRAEDYGGSGYTARDQEGNVWSFGTYRPEMS